MAKQSPKWAVQKNQITVDDRYVKAYDEFALAQIKSPKAAFHATQVQAVLSII